HRCFASVAVERGGPTARIRTVLRGGNGSRILATLRPAHRTRRASGRRLRRVHGRTVSHFAAWPARSGCVGGDGGHGVLSGWLAGASAASVGLDTRQDPGGHAAHAGSWALHVASQR